MFQQMIEREFVVSQNAIDLLNSTITHNQATRDIQGVEELTKKCCLEYCENNYARLIYNSIDEISKGVIYSHAIMEDTNNRVRVSLKLSSNSPIENDCYNLINQAIYHANSVFPLLSLEDGIPAEIN